MHRIYREQTGASLKDATDMIEDLERKLDLADQSEIEHSQDAATLLRAGRKLDAIGSTAGTARVEPEGCAVQAISDLEKVSAYGSNVQALDIAVATPPPAWPADPPWPAISTQRRSVVHFSAAHCTNGSVPAPVGMVGRPQAFPGTADTIRMKRAGSYTKVGLLETDQRAQSFLRLEGGPGGTSLVLPRRSAQRPSR